jgi:SAM-dependent methyltransferase
MERAHMTATTTTTHTTPDAADEVRQAVQEKYGAIARSAGTMSCGPFGCGCSGGAGDPVSSNLYSALETDGLPEEAVRASLGCGNPTALLALEPGQVVLDLGSGGGIDVLLSAKRVGPAGKAYGLDMTDDMLALARENQRRAGATNVEFLQGSIEAIPLPDASVDVIISNCVINLSSDKDAVLAEAFRVLRPGGRFAVSDVVVRGDVPEAVRRSMELWVGCIAGALEERDYAARLRKAGFEDVGLETWRVYGIDAARDFLTGAGIDVDRIAPEVEGRFASAFIRARKPMLVGTAGTAGTAGTTGTTGTKATGSEGPAVQPCCGPSCCS